MILIVGKLGSYDLFLYIGSTIYYFNHIWAILQKIILLFSSYTQFS